MSERVYFSAFLGFLFGTGLDMFRQDLWGKEKYMQMVDLLWVDLSPYWGLGIMIIAMVLISREATNAKRGK